MQTELTENNALLYLQGKHMPQGMPEVVTGRHLGNEGKELIAVNI